MRAGVVPPTLTDDEPLVPHTLAPAHISLSSHAWDRIEAAHGAVTRLAAKHGLGFFDVSSDLAEAWLPDRKGGLRLAHSD